MDDFKNIVAENITKLRTNCQMTQAELGEKLNYSDKSISKWERGEAVPDAYVLQKMGRIFGVSVDYLLTEHADTEKPPVNFLGLGRRYSRGVVTMIAVMGIFTLAILVFVIVWLCSGMEWMIFVYAVPVALITLLVLNSAWNGGRHNAWIVSGLVWSILATIYLSWADQNWWQIFLLGIPAEIIIFLSFRVKTDPQSPKK